MSEDSRRKTAVAVLLVLWLGSSVVAVAFGVLWSREHLRPPREIIREVAAGKEANIPAPMIGDFERSAVDFVTRYSQARFSQVFGAELFNISSVNTVVSVEGGAKGLVMDNRIRNKFELNLRKHKIEVSDSAGVTVSLRIQGLWEKEHRFVVYTTRVEVNEFVPVLRDGEWKRLYVTIWAHGESGFAGSQLAESAILESVESLAESFANAFWQGSRPKNERILTRTPDEIGGLMLERCRDRP